MTVGIRPIFFVTSSTIFGIKYELFKLNFSAHKNSIFVTPRSFLSSIHFVKQHVVRFRGFKIVFSLSPLSRRERKREREKKEFLLLMLFLFFFKKKTMGRSRPFFLDFRLFYKQFRANIGSIKFANDWIRTADLWFWKQPLCQLNHNHCSCFCCSHSRTSCRCCISC